MTGNSNWDPKLTSRADEHGVMETLDPALKQALGEFKASVRAWSDAAYNRPRAVQSAVLRRSWSLAAGWSLAAILLAGTLSGGVYEHHERVAAARIAGEQKAEQQRQEAARRAQAKSQDGSQQEDDVLASVDKDVSREVPSAMEALAQLSDEGESR